MSQAGAGSVPSDLVEMYARQHPRAGGVWFARAGGIVLLSVSVVSLLYWLGFGFLGLARRFDPGFEWPFIVLGFVAAVGALARRRFRVTTTAAILSIFSIGPWAIALVGGLVAVGLLFAAGDNAFRS